MVVEMGLGYGLDSLYGRQTRTPPAVVNLIGCGGGAWVAIYSAMAGTKKLRLFDDDTIETSNLNRLPYPPDWVGKKKTTALRDYILQLRPDIVIETYPAVRDKLQLDLCKDGKWVIAIDSLEARKWINEHLMDTQGTPLHVNFEKDKYKVSWGLWKSEESEIEVDTGYLNPNEQYVTCSSIACAMAVAWLMDMQVQQLEEE
jgi:molybdopterin/thiamine biosynthesis adenylyltransferase